VESVLRTAGRPLRLGAMLDLGCGTGLAGSAFRPFVDWLVGVDLSPAMVAQAAGKGLYDRLVTADLTGFLAGEIGGGGKYHLVTAADVFVYVNDLVPVVAAVARILAPDGLLACTVETHSGDGAKLLPTLRFAYGAGYLRAIIADAGLTLLHLAGASIRTENGVPVQGLVLVAAAAA
jgi:predicted TPR repeat methyltransferase